MVCSVHSLIRVFEGFSWPTFSTIDIKAARFGKLERSLKQDGKGLYYSSLCVEQCGITCSLPTLCLAPFSSLMSQLGTEGQTHAANLDNSVLTSEDSLMRSLTDVVSVLVVEVGNEFIHFDFLCPLLPSYKNTGILER